MIPSTEAGMNAGDLHELDRWGLWEQHAATHQFASFTSAYFLFLGKPGQLYFAEYFQICSWTLTFQNN